MTVQQHPERGEPAGEKPGPGDQPDRSRTPQPRRPDATPGGPPVAGDLGSVRSGQGGPSAGRVDPRFNRSIVIVAFAGYAAVIVYLSQRWDLPPVGPRAAALIGLALAVELAAKTLFAIQFRHTLRLQNQPVSLRASIRAGFIGTAVARLVPAGGALSPSAMAWAVRDEGDHAAGAALRTTFTSYGGLLLMTGLALGWATAGGDVPHTSIGAVAAVTALAAAGAVTLIGSRWIGRLVSILPRLLRVHFGPTASGGGITSHELALIGSRIALEALVLWIVLRAFGIDLGFDQALITFGVAKAIGGLPATPGGIGLVEGGMVGVLATMGFPAESVLAPVLVYQIIDYWIVAALGIAAAGRISRTSPRTVPSF